MTVTQTSLDIGRNIAAQVTPIFARHETFHPRFGWLKKGFDLANKDPEIFLRDDAPVRLGVGKNMVRSIRYWCKAFKVLEEDSSTQFGKELLSHDGWDPFLEDPASLWLLHWNLLKPTCEAAAWYYTFNRFQQVEFTTEDLLEGLQKYREELGINTADSSLKKDVTCILRMYSETENKNKLIEDSIDCPFAELGLLRTAGTAKQYTFRVGQKVNLPAEIVVVACLEYAQKRGSSKTISISSLAYDAGSPGLAFKLPESVISEAIEQVARTTEGIALSDTAGIIQFSFNQDATERTSHGAPFGFGSFSSSGTAKTELHSPYDDAPVSLLVQDILDQYYRTRSSR